MTSLLIVYHSQSGTSAKLARACWRSACRVEAVATRVCRAWDAGTADILTADGLILVAAENSASVSGGMKDFLDRTFYPVAASGRVLPCALLVSAGNDGRGARQQVERILSGYPMRLAMATSIFRGEFTALHRQQAAELGEGFATGLEMGIF
ncbi:flavodoxin [Kineobactrum sediminis]|uniref:Flavodoxin n=1 Tax=Kineobactrum sediminis TaxID=1905677 RepID=A0A2N5Y2U8_9GAMM|nr:NAD(P)H-dependent oxidoreductase [Kineobactrum sediminis]PLW82723.1 flavodoxin [Kineobactrum sediminis]